MNRIEELVRLRRQTFRLDRGARKRRGIKEEDAKRHQARKPHRIKRAADVCRALQRPDPDQQKEKLRMIYPHRPADERYEPINSPQRQRRRTSQVNSAREHV